MNESNACHSDKAPQQPLRIQPGRRMQQPNPAAASHIGRESSRRAAQAPECLPVHHDY